MVRYFKLNCADLITYNVEYSVDAIELQRIKKKSIKYKISVAVSKILKHKAEIQEFRTDVHNYSQVIHN